MRIKIVVLIVVNEDELAKKFAKVLPSKYGIIFIFTGKETFIKTMDATVWMYLHCPCIFSPVPLDLPCMSLLVLLSWVD